MPRTGGRSCRIVLSFLGGSSTGRRHQRSKHRLRGRCLDGQLTRFSLLLEFQGSRDAGLDLNAFQPRRFSSKGRRRGWLSCGHGLLPRRR